MLNTSFQGEFIEQAEAIILENISNEQFGVSELADLMNMSRSNLLRKIKNKRNLVQVNLYVKFALKKVWSY